MAIRPVIILSMTGFFQFMCSMFDPTSHPQQPEVALFSFGPFGVSICRGPYSVWKWQHKNSTLVELTDRRILGVPNKRWGPLSPRPLLSRLSFDIPYSCVVSAEVRDHPARLGLMSVLILRYLRGPAEEEVLSICSYNGNIRRAQEVIAERMERAFMEGGQRRCP